MRQSAEAEALEAGVGNEDHESSRHFHVDCGWEDLFVPEDHHRRGARRLVGIPGAAAATASPRCDSRHERVVDRGRTRARSAALDASLYAHHPHRARAGSHQNAAGAILNACLDIKGKALGVPVYELFGGAVRERMPVYWSRCGVIRRAARTISTAR